MKSSSIPAIPDSLRHDPNMTASPWEEFLKGIAKDRDKREILVDPHILQQLHINDTVFSLMNGLVPTDTDETERQIDLVRRIAQKKLKGLARYCVLLLLTTGVEPKRLAEILGTTTDTVNRVLERSIRTIRHCLSNNFGEFPTQSGKRPSIRASIWPLDTPRERERFQHFLNDHTVVHVSYRGDDMFREVLVVYMTGKTANRRG